MVAAGRFFLPAALAGYFFLFPLPGAAQDNYPPPIAPEAAKLTLLEDMQRDEISRLLPVALPEQAEEQRDWCRRFLGDLAAGGKIIMVEPVARSDLYGDYVFSSWQNNCPALAMNASRGPAPLTLYRDFPKLPIAMADGRLLDGYQFGTRNFKLYETDLDNNPDNGKDIIFYSERAYSYWEAVLKVPELAMALPPIDRNWNDILPPEKVPPMFTYWGSNYKMLGWPACFAYDLLQPEDPYDYAAGRPQANYNGILTYEGRSYLFTWQWEPLSNLRELGLYEVKRSGNGVPDVEPVCRFR